MIYNACVLGKLLYSLETLSLRAADLARLDAFHAQTLRRICGIPHSMFSHISGAAVWRMSAQRQLRKTLLYRQLLLYGRIAGMPDNSVMRSIILKPGSCVPVSPAVRGRGRPRLRWETTLYAHALNITSGDQRRLEQILLQSCHPDTGWKSAVAAYCLSPNG